MPRPRSAHEGPPSGQNARLRDQFLRAVAPGNFHCAPTPTDEDDTYVDFVREGVYGSGAARSGDGRWRRLVEKRAGVAKSVILLEVASGYQVLILGPEGYDYVGGLSFEGYGLLRTYLRLSYRLKTSAEGAPQRPSFVPFVQHNKDQGAPR